MQTQLLAYKSGAIAIGDFDAQKRKNYGFDIKKEVCPHQIMNYLGAEPPRYQGGINFYFTQRAGELNPTSIKHINL